MNLIYFDEFKYNRHTLVYYAILPLEQRESANAVTLPGQTGGETDHGKG